MSRESHVTFLFSSCSNALLFQSFCFETFCVFNSLYISIDFILRFAFYLISLLLDYVGICISIVDVFVVHIHMYAVHTPGWLEA